MTPITHITPKEQALERENERLTDQVKRQSATIHVQALGLQSYREEIEGWKADQRENIEITVKQQAEINALKADAERYLWLRDNDMFANPSVDMARIFSRYADSFLDGHIDAAMKETK